jgi:RNA polymerase sigma factor (sigma-70 family)
MITTPSSAPESPDVLSLEADVEARFKTAISVSRNLGEDIYIVVRRASALPALCKLLFWEAGCSFGGLIVEERKVEWHLVYLFLLPRRGWIHVTSLRTWVYRVANNVGADHLAKRRKASERLVEIEVLSLDPTAQGGQAQERRREDLAELQALIRRLAPLDRQIILLYLEGATAVEIADVTGLTPGNTATKIHRIKKLLNRNFSGAPHECR